MNYEILLSVWASFSITKLAFFHCSRVIYCFWENMRVNCCTAPLIWEILYSPLLFITVYLNVNNYTVEICNIIFKAYISLRSCSHVILLNIFTVLPKFETNGFLTYHFQMLLDEMYGLIASKYHLKVHYFYFMKKQRIICWDAL